MTSSTIWQYCPAHNKLCHYIPVQHLLYSAINRNVHGTSQCGEDIESRQRVYTYILISVFMLIIVGSTTVHAQKRDKHVTTIIGASLSEPHIDDFAVNFLYIYMYRTSCRKSLPARILRVLASCVISKLSHYHETETRTI